MPHRLRKFTLISYPCSLSIQANADNGTPSKGCASMSVSHLELPRHFLSSHKLHQLCRFLFSFSQLLTIHPLTLPLPRRRIWPRAPSPACCRYPRAILRARSHPHVHHLLPSSFAHLIVIFFSPITLTRTSPCMSVYAFACASLFTLVHVHIRIDTCFSMRVHTCIHLHVYLHIRVRVQLSHIGHIHMPLHDDAIAHSHFHASCPATNFTCCRVLYSLLATCVPFIVPLNALILHVQTSSKPHCFGVDSV